MIAGEREERGAAPPPGPSASRSTGDEIGDAWKEARAHIDELVEEARERGRLALARARLKLWAGLFQAIVIVVLALVLVAASASGAWLLASGVRGGLARVLPDWLADLGTGLLVLGSIVVALLMLRARLYRRVLQGLRPLETQAPKAPRPLAAREDPP